MSLPLLTLGWTLVLAMAQVSLPSILKTRQYGTGWNVSARDEAMPPPWQVTQRLERAQRNLFENLPVFAAAVLLAHASGRETTITAIGAQIFLWARLLYVPLYAGGVPVVRSLVYLVSLVGIAMVLFPLLVP